MSHCGNKEAVLRNLAREWISFILPSSSHLPIPELVHCISSIRAKLIDDGVIASLEIKYDYIRVISVLNSTFSNYE